MPPPFRDMEVPDMNFTGKKNSFAGQRRRSALLNHRVLLGGGALALGALFLLGQFGDTGVASWWKLKAEEDQLQEEVTDLEAANLELEARLEALANDPDALEKLAREQHNMRRQEEEVLKVLDRSDASENPDG
ncbi:MAG: septum formation initiator family protein [Desulfobacterales bacterium]|nr:septum formation initiator family protein [Desulfobacterales bacterium]